MNEKNPHSICLQAISQVGFLVHESITNCSKNLKLDWKLLDLLSMAVFLFDSELYIGKTRAEKYSITARLWSSYFIFIFPPLFRFRFDQKFPG